MSNTGRVNVAGMRPQCVCSRTLICTTHCYKCSFTTGGRVAGVMGDDGVVSVGRFARPLQTLISKIELSSLAPSLLLSTPPAHIHFHAVRLVNLEVE